MSQNSATCDKGGLGIEIAWQGNRLETVGGDQIVIRRWLGSGNTITVLGRV